jgi:hypothetical protein
VAEAVHVASIFPLPSDTINFAPRAR